MNTNSGTSFTATDFLGLASKYKLLIIASTILSMAAFTAVSFALPSKYKSHFVLTIYPKYFQSILIGDFIPEMSESGDMRTERESLIRQVLSPEYLDYLGQKYGIYGSPTEAPASEFDLLLSRLKALGEKTGLLSPENHDSLLSLQRTDLRTRIDIFDLNNTTFNIGFIYSDPKVTYDVTQDIYAQVIRSLLEMRMHTLVNIRDAIQRRLASIGTDMSALPAPVSTPTSTEMVENELKEVRSQIATLSDEYTDEHPLVIQLRDRERLLVNRLANSYVSAAPHSSSGRDKEAANSGAGEANREIYDDLSKKMNYVNIAIDSDKAHQSDYFAALEMPLFPASPLWPKKGLFLIWGAAFGFFGALFIAAIRDYFERSALHTATVAHQLGLPVVGELPALPTK